MVSSYPRISSFESSVVLDGTKTDFELRLILELFESSVVLDGTKTKEDARQDES